MAVPEWLRSLSGGLLVALEKEHAPDPGTPRRVADQFGQWVAHLSKSATVNWTPYLLRSEDCSFAECEADAIADCISCGDPCCLGHSHVSHRGELICDECVDEAIGRKRKLTDVQKAFKFFNLTPDANADELTALFRLRSKSAHPDRGGSNMDKTTRYYHLLKDHLEKQRAA